MQGLFANVMRVIMSTQRLPVTEPSPALSGNQGTIYSLSDRSTRTKIIVGVNAESVPWTTALDRKGADRALDWAIAIINMTTITTSLVRMVPTNQPP